MSFGWLAVDAQCRERDFVYGDVIGADIITMEKE